MPRVREVKCSWYTQRGERTWVGRCGRTYMTLSRHKDGDYSCEVAHPRGDGTESAAYWSIPAKYAEPVARRICSGMARDRSMMAYERAGLAGLKKRKSRRSR